jgi:hypothetical protein
VFVVLAAGFLGVLVLALPVLYTYEHFAGENPIIDMLYDLRLRHSDLAALDRTSAANLNCADIIVTLTTLPSRIERIDMTLKSLLRQTLSPAAIRINIPHTSRREGRAYEVPSWLRRLRSVHIVRCEDFGPSTKLIPTLLDAGPEQRLLVVDDDRIYHPHFIEQMVAAAQAQPDAAVAGSGWDAPSDLTDRPSTLVATLLGRLWPTTRARPRLRSSWTTSGSARTAARASWSFVAGGRTFPRYSTPGSSSDRASR